MNETFEQCRKNLLRRGFEVRIAATTEEARQILREEIRAAAPETISFGGSMTMEATGIVDELRRAGGALPPVRRSGLHLTSRRTDRDPATGFVGRSVHFGNQCHHGRGGALLARRDRQPGSGDRLRPPQGAAGRRA